MFNIYADLENFNLTFLYNEHRAQLANGFNYIDSNSKNDEASIQIPVETSL